MIRPAAPKDLHALVAMIGELAEYEHALDQVEVDEDLLDEALFGDAPLAAALVATIGDEVVAMVIYFENFSTWTGRGGLHVEDLYVRPEFRGRGVGKALLIALARQASERDFARMDWAALDWNTPAIAFYRSLGAGTLEEWTTFRLSGSALSAVAAAPAPDFEGSPDGG